MLQDLHYTSNELGAKKCILGYPYNTFPSIIRKRYEYRKSVQYWKSALVIKQHKTIKASCINHNLNDLKKICSIVMLPALLTTSNFDQFCFSIITKVCLTEFH